MQANLTTANKKTDSVSLPHFTFEENPPGHNKDGWAFDGDSDDEDSDAEDSDNENDCPNSPIDLDPDQFYAVDVPHKQGWQYYVRHDIKMSEAILHYIKEKVGKSGQGMKFSEVTTHLWADADQEVQASYACDDGIMVVHRQFLTSGSGGQRVRASDLLFALGHKVCGDKISNLKHIIQDVITNENAEKLIIEAASAMGNWDPKDPAKFNEKITTFEPIESEHVKADSTMDEKNKNFFALLKTSSLIGMAYMVPAYLPKMNIGSISTYSHDYQGGAWYAAVELEPYKKAT